MIYQSIVAIAFRILNFSVLCVCAVYMYKKYVRPKLIDLKEKKQRLVERLHHQQEATQRHYDVLCATAQQHTQQYELLKNKLDQWKVATTHQYAQWLYEKNDRMRLVHERADMRVRMLQAELIAARVMPVVLKNSYEQAYKKFHGQAGQHFVQRIIAQLQESK
jgi:succinylglutamate desuccinylase